MDPPFSNRQIDFILREWSKLFTPDQPTDLYVGGGAAESLCVGFQQAAGLIINRKFWRNARDINYILDPEPQTRDDQWRMERRLSWRCFVPYYDMSNKNFVDDVGGLYVEKYAFLSKQYFYKMPIFVDQEPSGLSIYVLKEEPLLGFKLERAVDAFKGTRRGQYSRREAHRYLRDVHRLCALSKTNTVEQLIAVSKAHTKLLRTQPVEASPTEDIWRRVTRLRENQARHSAMSRSRTAKSTIYVV